MDIKYMEVIVISMLFVTALNIYACVFIWRAPAYERTQKILQTILIWLIPIAGALFCIGFLEADRGGFSKRGKIQNITAISDEDAIDFAISSNRESNINDD
jgi:hypothetical protein